MLRLPWICGGRIFKSMKKILFSILVPLILMSACKSDSDILAEMDGGVITRGEFREWLNSKGIPLENMMKSRNAYIMNLEQLGVEKLTSKKALEENFDHDPYFIKLHDIIYRNYTAAYFRDYIYENMDFNETAADISIIKLNFENNPGPGRKSLSDSNFIMTHEILPLIEKGLSFEDAAAKYSQDPSAKNGGRLGFVAGAMYDEIFEKHISGLKEKEYSREPVISGNSLYLIKVNRFVSINRKNIKSIISDESNLEDMRKHIFDTAMERIEKSAFESFNVKSYIMDITYSRGSEVVFSVSGEAFTVKDLNDILEIFYELKYGSKPLKKMTKENKIITSRKILSETLQFREALAMGIHTDREFEKRWNMVKRSTLSGAYKYRTLADQVVVTAADVAGEYRSNLNKRYYRIQKRGSGHIKVPIPFSEVRDRIRQELFRDGMTSMRKKWDVTILGESNFVINESFISEK